MYIFLVFIVLIYIVMIFTIIYDGYKSEHGTPRFIIDLKNKYYDRKLNKIKHIKLSSQFPNYWMWEEGDILIVKKDGFDGMAKLRTFSNRFVIAHCFDSNKQLIYYTPQIIGNKTQEERFLVKEAESFQKNKLPEIYNNNINDLKLLQHYEER